MIWLILIILWLLETAVILVVYFHLVLLLLPYGILFLTVWIIPDFFLYLFQKGIRLHIRRVHLLYFWIHILFLPLCLIHLFLQLIILYFQGWKMYCLLTMWLLAENLFLVVVSVRIFVYADEVLLTTVRSLYIYQIISGWVQTLHYLNALHLHSLMTFRGLFDLFVGCHSRVLV